MIQAHYFDHRQAMLHKVVLHFQASGISLTGEGIDRLVDKNQMQLEEPFQDAPCILNFADGSHCEIYAQADKQNLLTHLGYTPSTIQRWQHKWQAALLAIIVMAGIVFSGYKWGMPVLADKIASFVPVSYERALGSEIINLLDQVLLKPSKLDDRTIAQAEQLIRRLRPEDSAVPIHLEVRDAPEIGANAFALPGGTVVVTDQLVTLIVGNSGNQLTNALADELSGVLAHEIGHIQNRHAMRRLVHKGLVTVAMGSLFGDFSSVAALAPAALVGQEYSREMEIEADTYAIAALTEKGISSKHLANVLEDMSKRRKRSGVEATPKWLRTVYGYASSHPATEERIARFREVAAAMEQK
ncbi:M48 family metallopeptidase [Undibacterium sp.]|uniref:M48 family metallopeptidase n=1 Tax=Undibacterium sp. TaxID=1914977 RepID=UPI002731DE91|nr:M48 family metallopeptidase [Undibacterium sp.]MDP1976325.1 M48 family metallopeptidase [Undibacterium sp.]